jgi:hypothetical protein
MKKMKEYVICSAIYYSDGKKYEHQPLNIETGFVVLGLRHCNCYVLLSILLGKLYNKTYVGRDGQGFLTNTNRFVDRKEAYLIAKEANQLLHNLHDESNLILCSEDLY